jgi:hypothetical protein
MNAHMETIAACGFEAIAPPPGMHSFTNSLIEVLEDWSNAPSFSVSMLFTEVLRVVMQRRKEKCPNGQKLEWRRTPVHISNSKHPREAPIELCKRRLIDVADFPTSQSPESIDGSLINSEYVAPTTYLDLMSLSCMGLEESLTKAAMKGKSAATDSPGSDSTNEQMSDSPQSLKTPHMLISVELDQDQDLPSSEACRRWIASFPGLAKHVTVDGVYHGYSTVLILSIPVVIWDTLPDNPACRPITYVTSRNLLEGTNITSQAKSILPMAASESRPGSNAAWVLSYDGASKAVVTLNNLEPYISGDKLQNLNHLRDLWLTVNGIEVNPAIYGKTSPSSSRIASSSIRLREKCKDVMQAVRYPYHYVFDFIRSKFSRSTNP